MTDPRDVPPTSDDDYGYDVVALEAKWNAYWERAKPFATNDPADKRPRKYVLDMFPYPSGELHMGHAEAFAFGDIAARYWRLRASTCFTRSAGTPSACPPRTPPSSAA